MLAFLLSRQDGFVISHDVLDAIGSDNRMGGLYAALAELERTMRINEDVIRYLTIRVDAHDDAPSVIMQSRGSRDDRQRRGAGDRERYGEGRDGATERADRPEPVVPEAVEA